MSCRAARAALLGLGVALAAACGPREAPVASGRPRSVSEEPSAAPPAAAPASRASVYALATEWSGPLAKNTVVLGKGELGSLIDGVRVVSSGARLRVAREVVLPHPLRAVQEMPARLGGGYIFLNDVALYHADTFDGPLTGLAYFPAGNLMAARPAFDRLLVRATDGSRWMLRVPGGERVPVEPPGLVEIVTHDDRLGLVMTDHGRLLATRDAGKTWRDVTSDVKGAPSALIARADGLYVTFVEGDPARLGSDGRLVRVPHLPDLPKRERDPRWRVSESPLRVALRAGVLAEEPGVAIVASSGDLARVSLRSGELLSVQPGRLPPDATCEGVRTLDDALFLCTRRNERLVVSGTLYGKTPRIEQSFAGASPFSASDDGAIAYAGPCSGPAREGVACVRGTSGSWVERGGFGDGGPPTALGYVVPRADGGAASLAISPKEIAALDLVTGEAHTFTDAALTVAGRIAGRTPMVRRDWSYGPDGVLRGWLGGRGVALPAIGSPTSSLFVGETALYGLAGPRALGASSNGRLFQTLDRGVTWAEIALPPSEGTAPTTYRSASAVQCGELGCAVGRWLRAGFPDDPPRPSQQSPHGSPPSEIASFASSMTVQCERQGAALGKVLASEKEHGLGASPIPTGFAVSASLGRALVHPVRADGGTDDAESARRALVVSAAAPFRLTASYLAPFDPLGVRRALALTTSDVAHALGAGGPAVEELTSNLSVSYSVPITPNDPAAPGGLLFAGERLAFWSRGGQTRVVVLPEDSTERVLSAVELPGDELVMLRSDAAQNLLQRVSAGGVLSTVMRWSGPEVTDRYPFTPDAVAVGPRGELGVLRLASGVEPASPRDPARILLPRGKVLTLAPWSTLVSASEPACRADTSGYRATLQVEGWLAEEDAPPTEEGVPTLVRVRWGEERVCLEGFELRGRVVSGDPASAGRRLEQWVVARALPRPQAGYLAIGAGFELRASGRCALR